MKEIKRTVPSITVIAGITFMPGVNTVSDPEYDLLQTGRNKAIFDSEISCGNMMYGRHIETSNSEAVGITDLKSKGYELAKELMSMSIDDAEDTIKNTGNHYVLLALKEQDGRKGIQELVDRRIKDIKEQTGSDLTAQSVPSNGDGSDFLEKIKGSEADLRGTKGYSNIPALNENERF